MSRLIYLTGPVRSGKSRRAVELASAWGDGVVFVGTWRRGANDPEMEERVQRHQRSRPSWRVLDAPSDIAAAVAGLQPPPSGMVLDCVTLWLGDRFEQSDEAIIAAWTEQLGRFRAAAWPTVIVGNEVGWSLVPETPELRRFRDLAGTLGQLTASMADEAWLMVAGCDVRLK